VKPVAAQGVPGYEAQGWFVLAAPKGTAVPVIERLNEALNEALNTPAVRDKLIGLGSDIVVGPPQAAAALVKQDFEKWGRVIRGQQLKFQ
jgi:tripartite-type tricarboxylate transporter receptor subunit TctC